MSKSKKMQQYDDDHILAPATPEPEEDALPHITRQREVQQQLFRPVPEQVSTEEVGQPQEDELLNASKQKATECLNTMRSVQSAYKQACSALSSDIRDLQKLITSLDVRKAMLMKRKKAKVANNARPKMQQINYGLTRKLRGDRV
jgi:hypothetical protein